MMLSSQRFFSRSTRTTMKTVAIGRSRFSTVLSDDAEFDQSKKDSCKKVLVSPIINPCFCYIILKLHFFSILCFFLFISISQRVGVHHVKL